jgi:hypothetical protein
MKLYRADGEPATVAECVDAAREQLHEERLIVPPTAPAAGRAFSESITHLDSARMWSNRGFCEARGEATSADMQRVQTVLPREI